MRTWRELLEVPAGVNFNIPQTGDKSDKSHLSASSRSLLALLSPLPGDLKSDGGLAERWISYPKWQAELQARVLRETPVPIAVPEKTTSFQLSFFLQLDELPLCDDQQQVHRIGRTARYSERGRSRVLPVKKRSSHTDMD